MVSFTNNNGAYIKKNYLSHLERLSAIYPGMSDMPSSNSLKTDTTRTGIDRPLFQESPYAPEHVQNVSAKKSENLKE